MEPIKTLVRKFQKSLVSHSHTAIDQPLLPEEPRSDEHTTTPSLDDLGLSPRVYNCLWKSGIHNIETVASIPDARLLNIRGLDTKSPAELKERLASHYPSDDNSQQTGNGVK